MTTARQQATEPTLLDLITAAKPKRPRPQPSTFVAHLERTTSPLDRDGIRRIAKLTACRHCDDRVLVGLDADVCAFPTTADPIPLNALGEALAVLGGIPTYSLTRCADGWLLDYRGSDAVTHAPAESQPRHDVVQAHRCGAGPPEGATARTTFAEARTAPVDHTSAPPF